MKTKRYFEVWVCEKVNHRMQWVTKMRTLFLSEAQTAYGKWSKTGLRTELRRVA
jgi:hypothetical protein